MQAKKILKIVGLIIGGFVILVAFLVVVAMNFPSTGQKSAYYQVSYGGINAETRQAGALSMAKGEMALDEVAFDSAAAPEVASGAVSSQSAGVDKKIIKTGSLSLKVEKADGAAEAIANIAKQNKGEVANSYFSQSSRGIKSGYITIRVPFQNFATTFEQIKKVATEVLSEASNAQDITEEYIDLEARLKNKRAEEQSFVALLSRSGKIEEVLSVTREIARVRGEIEQLDGQMRYLNSQTDMSTITVNLSEDIEITPVSQDWRPWQVIKTSVKQLINSSQNFIDGLIRFLIIVLPILLIWALIIWLIYVIGKKVYRKFKKPLQ